MITYKTLKKEKGIEKRKELNSRVKKAEYFDYRVSILGLVRVVSQFGRGESSFVAR